MHEDHDAPPGRGIESPAGFVRALLAIAGFAGVLAAVHVFELATRSPFFAHPLVDAEEYDLWARDIAGGHILWSTSQIHAPLYPLLLGLVYTLTGGSYLAPRLAQSFLFGWNVFAVGLLGRRVGGARAGLISAGAAALFGPALHLQAQLLPETVFCALGLGALLCLSRLVDRPAAPMAFGGGLLLGLSLITRLNLAPFVFLAAAWAAWRWRLQPRRAALLAGLILFGAAAPVAPVALHNRRIDPDPVLIQRFAGVNFYLGANPGADGAPNVRPGRDWVRLMAWPAREGVRGSGAQERFFRRQAWAYATQHPGRTAQLVVRKALLYLNRAEIPASFPADLERPYSVILRGPLLSFGVLLPLGVAGFVGFWRRRPEAKLLTVFVLALAAGSLATVVAGRYRAPSALALAALAGPGLESLLHSVRLRRWGLPILCGILILAAHAPLVKITDASRGERAYLHAQAYWKAGDVARAKEAAAQAVRWRPEHPDTHWYLGVLWEMGDGAVRYGPGADLERARSEYRQALALDPGYLEAWQNLSALELEAGAAGAAEAAARGGLEHDAQDARLNCLLAMSLFEQQRFPESLAAADRCAALDAAAPFGPALRGDALRRLGRSREALDAYREALRRHPDYAPARRWVDALRPPP